MEYYTRQNNICNEDSKEDMHFVGANIDVTSNPKIVETSSTVSKENELKINTTFMNK